MIRVNNNIAIDIISNLKSQSFPAYTNWTDYVSLWTLPEKDCILLYSGEVKINNFFKKEEFYFLKNILKERNPVIYGIVFHTPYSIKKDDPYKEEYYAEIAFVKSPVLEPSGIGEIVFQQQSIRLDQDNQINIIEFLELEIPNKIKDIFLFNINEFSNNGA